MPELEILNTLLNGGIALVFLYFFWIERAGSKQKSEQMLAMAQKHLEDRIADYKLWLEMQNDLITYTGARKMLPPPTTPNLPSVNAPKDKKP